jgi:hypothetical protein
MRNTELPIDFENWLSKLVFEEKRDYARQIGEAVLTGGEMPQAPSSAKWVGKCERRVVSILRPFM